MDPLTFSFEPAAIGSDKEKKPEKQHRIDFEVTNNFFQLDWS